MNRIDLNWADSQYWSTLFEVIGEVAKFHEKPQKKKVSTDQISKMIVKKGGSGGREH